MRRRLLVRTGAAALAVGAFAACSSSERFVGAPPSTSTSVPATVASGDYSPGRHVASFSVAGTARSAIVVVPANTAKPAPLVFVFHGHGGRGQGIERKLNIEGLWPAAIVVYPDGVVGHKGVTDPQGTEPGWQTRAGEAGDRDLAFYDTMLATLKAKLSVDPNRVYVMGHSNGSAFASLLLNQRGDAIAATANLSSQPNARLLAGDPMRSMFMAMGRADAIVPFANQERSIPLVEHKLGVDAAQTTKQGYLSVEHGRDGLELDTYIYPGGHEPPPEVAPLIVAFLQRHALTPG